MKSIGVRILFRADGNAYIGAGHIMRCLSIATKARRRGIECLFVVSDNSFEQLIIKRGFKVQVLNTDYRLLSSEIDTLQSIISDYLPSLLILDSYYATNEYMEWIRNNVKLAYIDDFGTTPYPVDILINYNIYSDVIKYKKVYDGLELPELIIGSKYTPLREEFSAIKKIPIIKSPKNILFSAGGSDYERIAINFVREVSNNSVYDKYNYHVIAGSFEPDIDDLLKISLRKENIIIHYNVENMSSIMKMSDVAISAAGTTLYELCSVGVPTLTYVLADNQLLGASCFDQKHAMINAGDYRKDQDLVKKLGMLSAELMDDYELRKTLQNNAVQCVDGKGSMRIVDRIGYILSKEIEHEH